MVRIVVSTFCTISTGILLLHSSKEGILSLGLQKSNLSPPFYCGKSTANIAAHFVISNKTNDKICVKDIISELKGTV